MTAPTRLDGEDDDLATYPPVEAAPEPAEWEWRVLAIVPARIVTGDKDSFYVFECPCCHAATADGDTAAHREWHEKRGEQP